jgi:YfiH family protein
LFHSKLLSKVNFIEHAFFGRAGGVSTGNFSSLNFSFKVGDVEQNVIQNREIIANKFQIDWNNILVLQQVHSTKVLWANNNICNAEGDGLIASKDSNIDKKHAIGVVTADCLPLLFVDTKLQIISAVHAGWRGLLNGILENTILEFTKKNSLVGNLLVAIGPSIRKESYEVDESFYSAFINKDSNSASFFTNTKHNKFLFDFTGYAVYKLKNLGLSLSQIDVLPHNTYLEEDNFFSHRLSFHKNEASRGLQLSVI